MSDESRRLSYRKRKKLGLTFSEAFMEGASPYKARSVDRGYASAMSPASVGQGDEQSEWDERQARVDQSDGLSRIMADLTTSQQGDEATEEIFVGEGNMKEAMLAAFFDELIQQECLDEAEVEKLAGSMDLIRQRRAMAAGKGSVKRTAAVGRGRMRGKVRSYTRGEAALSPEQLAARKVQAESAQQALQSGSAHQFRLGREVAGARANAPGERVQLAGQVRRGEAAPAPGRTQAANDAIAPSQIAAERAALSQTANPGQTPPPEQAQVPVPGQTPVPGAPAEPGWLAQRWNALTDPVAQAYQSGAGIGAYPGAIWAGMKASPLLGAGAAGLAGMALLPPAMRAAGLQKDSPGAVPGYVNIPG